MNNNNNNHLEPNQGNFAPIQNNLNDIKRHRRSKHEQEGRSFVCTYCDKSYLSKPALNNHLNTKHGDILAQMNITKRSRGRPRKKFGEDQENGFALNQYKLFFASEKRAKIENQEIDVGRVIRAILDELYLKYNNVMFKPVNDIKDSPILEHLVSGIMKGTGLKICDDIVCHYLDTIRVECNERYFVFVNKFVLLFRECFNLTEKTKKEDYAIVEYTSKESAELFPEQCNDFFSVFMENNGFFGFDEDEKAELIEIIQHFCFWLFINNYTKSKLSLAG